MTTVRTPEDVLAAVPFMVGYKPKDSVVVVGIKDDAFDYAMRIDYPEKEDYQCLELLGKNVLKQGSDAALIISYVPESIEEPNAITSQLSETFSELGIPLTDALVVHNQKFKSLKCEDETCCPPEGKDIPVLEESRIATEQVFDGKTMPLDNIDELKSVYVYKESIAAVEQLLSSTRDIDSNEDRRAAVVNFHNTAKDFNNLKDKTDLNAVAFFISSLQDIQVRDYVMGSINSDNRESLQEFLLWVLQRTPQGYQAPVATLLGLIEYELGNGSAGNILLGIALEDTTDYSLAKLLRRVFGSGFPPAAIEEMRKELHPKVVEAIFGE